MKRKLPHHQKDLRHGEQPTTKNNRILKLLNQHKSVAWEKWPDALKRPLRTISSDSDGIANSCTFGPSREYFFRKHGDNGSSEFVEG